MTVNNSGQTLKHWQVRIFISVWVTYFAYYLCRYNMTVAATPLRETFSWSKSQIGIIFSALTLMYALGQFVNGQLADRFGTRIIASIGVLGSVILNLLVFAVVVIAPKREMSSQTILWLLTFFWGINGFFQAMGWSPMVRVMAHWFPANTRGKVMGFMGTCYQFGGAFSIFLAIFLTSYYVQKLGGHFSAVFSVPAILFALIGIFFYLMIRNYPRDVGLSPVDPDDTSDQLEAGEPVRTINQNILQTLKNPYIWVIAGTFFMLDLNRYGFVNWLPSYLDAHESMAEVGTWNFKLIMKRCIHPLAGSAGAIIAGWATDRFFGGRRAPVIAILLLLLGIFSIIFPFIDPNNSWLIILVVAMVGFCTYGPHILMVGHAAMDFGKKSGAAGAAGFIDGMGYIGAALAGWGAGALIDIERFGFKYTFVIFGFAAILGALLVSVIWKVKPKH